jgi:rod shape-determining protein MreC
MLDRLKRFRLFFTAIFFLFLALLILTLYSKEDRETSVLERVLLQVSFPFQRGVQKAFFWVRELGEDYIFLTQVQKENRNLQRTLSTLREENNHLREALLAEGRLQKLSNWQSRNSHSSQVAQVYARGPASWFQTVLVNRGSKDGVSKEMAVVTSEGVVGRVIEVSPDAAKVLLVTDANSGVDVIVQRSRSQGIMEGKTDGVCILKYVQKIEDVQVGDKVITSGLGGIFPRGLVVATVSQVNRKLPGIFQYIEVVPTVDFSKLEEVLILAEESRP